MKNIPLLLLLSTLMLFACKDDTPNVNCYSCLKIEKLSREQAQRYLQSLYTEIENLSTSVACTDASMWKIVPIGAKACGGQSGFIPYHPVAHGEQFLKKVDEYTKAQEAFNKKWNVVSDCMAIPKPTQIECVDGKAKMIP